MMGSFPSAAGTALNPIGQGLAAGACPGVTRRGNRLFRCEARIGDHRGRRLPCRAWSRNAGAIWSRSLCLRDARKAGDLVRKAGKPGADPEVVESGRNFLVGRGHLPGLISGGTFTPEGMARRFAAMKAPLARAVGLREAEADASGVRINMEEALRNAREQMQGLQDARRLALSTPEFESSHDWLKGRALVPDATVRQQIAQSEIPYQGRTVPLIGKEDVFQKVRGEPILNKRSTGSRRGSYAAIHVRSCSGRSARCNLGYQNCRTTTRRAGHHINGFGSGNLKRAMQDVAYESDPSASAPKAGRVAAAKGIEQQSARSSGKRLLPLRKRQSESLRSTMRRSTSTGSRGAGTILRQRRGSRLSSLTSGGAGAVGCVKIPRSCTGS